MAANIRYTALASNRLRAGITAGTQQVLTATLTVSDLTFQTTKKSRKPYEGPEETIVLDENDFQNLTISYLDATAILQAREWYKSVSGGETFEIDVDGGSAYANCVLMDAKYSESRMSDETVYSVSFRVRWT